MEPYQYLFKTIVIGDGMVGKTSLTLRFAHGTFRERYLMTIGVEFAVKIVEVDNKKVKLQIWDTGGQERFSYVRPLYYRGAAGGLVCFDLTNRDTLYNVEKWMNEARKYSGLIPFVLVGTKADLEDQREVSYEEGLEYAKNHGLKYFETSAKTGQNVNEAFKALAAIMLEKELRQREWI
ncbi:MAG: Rab family GTPase [Candidatus Asgardarchaeia archaeon]